MISGRYVAAGLIVIAVILDLIGVAYSSAANGHDWHTSAILWIIGQACLVLALVFSHTTIEFK